MDIPSLYPAAEGAMQLLQAILGRIATEWPLISSAPFSALSLMMVALALGWAAHWLLYRAHIATMRERLALAVDRLADVNEKHDIVEQQFARLQEEIRTRDLSRPAEMAIVRKSAASTANAIEESSTSNAALSSTLGFHPFDYDLYVVRAKNR